MTRIFRPLARSATMLPILPAPIRPSTLPVISTPMNRFFSHLPAWVEALAAGRSRARASISEMACSAVVMELPKGVFMTMTPAAVAAGISTLSTPMPARATTFSFLAALMTSAVILVAERMAMPSYLSTTASNSSLVMSGLLSISTPRSLKMATAAGESLSAIRTLGMGVSGKDGGRKNPGRAAARIKSGGLGGAGLDLGEGPVEPGRQRLDVGFVHRGAAPDAQARRRGAIAGHVQRHAFF